MAELSKEEWQALACGFKNWRFTELEDTVQLHNLPLVITVGVDRNDPTKNVIKAYKAKAAQTQQPAQKPQASGAAPWAR